jgi:D-alanyl-D-alanine dipeptidase
LKVFDAYRPQKAVDHFVRWAEDPADTLTKQKYYPNVAKDRLFELGYIARKSGHTRGSTLDLTVVNFETGVELDMGSPWDFFGDISHHDSPLVGEEATVNRELLRGLMLEEGFRPAVTEWWHYTLEDEPFPERYFDFDVE